MELPELGETSTDNEFLNISPSSSTPATPSYPENPRASWGHQRSWSTSILGPPASDRSKNMFLNPNENSDTAA